MSSSEFTTAPARPDGARRRPGDGIFDPLRYCIFTTIALLGWLVGPAPMVVVTSGIGLVAYYRARRAGLTRSRCVLGDTRLVMLYLGIACVAGVTATVITLQRSR